MSDYDRGKFYGKKKFQSQSQRDNSSNFGSRFFNSKSTNNKSGSRESLTSEKPKIKQPTILLKTREHDDRSVSPKRSAKETDTAATPITIAVSVSNEAHSIPAPKQMTKCVKFLEDNNISLENVQDFMQENNDFLVVGVVGAQGVGKSTILNLLAHTQVTDELKRALFNDVKQRDNAEHNDNFKILTDKMSHIKVCEDNKTKDNIVFNIRQISDIEVDNNTTDGIDLFVTSNRVILLDSQPFNSIAVLDELIQSDNKRSNLVNEFLPIENSGEIYGLQQTAFLMSVCHILIVVQDWFFDSNVVRFIQTAEMLKPTLSSVEEEIVDHFPHLVLLHNRAQMENFCPSGYMTMQKIYRQIFNKTKLHLETGLGLGSGRLISCLSAENCGDPLNIYLIPEYTEEESHYKGYPSLEDLVKHLRANILGAAKSPLTHVQLSEKHWLLYCSKVWEHVKKSSFFVEYTKLMP